MRISKEGWRVSAITIAAFLLAIPYPYSAASLLAGIPVLMAMVMSGIWAASRAGIPSPAVPRASVSKILLFLGMGAGLGTVIVLLLRYPVAAMEPRIVERLARDAAVPLWKWAIILFHAPVLEEVVFRLFLLSLIAWALSKARTFRTGGGSIAAPGLVAANIVSALLFAGVHLPAWYQAGPVPASLLLSVIGINLLAGYAFGSVYVSRGLACAVVAHLAWIFAPNCQLTFGAPTGISRPVGGRPTKESVWIPDRIRRRATEDYGLAWVV
jgi:membrane protease YdiL (CAAX protease family)